VADDDFNRRNIAEFRAHHGRLGGQFEGAPVHDYIEVHAVELHGAERDAKYAVQAERYPGFAGYQRKTTRTVPVVALVPSETP
jgi:hypothetical protein